MAEGFEVETKVPEDISTVAADFGAEMVDFDDDTHDAAFVQFEVDTDSSFPDPTQLSDEVDIGLFAQNNEVFKRGQDLMPDTDYFVRAQAENVVYSDESLFSTAAQESEGFIIDVSNNDLDNAITSELAVTPMSNFDESTYNLLKHPDVVSNFWSLDQATQNFWDAGSFSGSSTEGVWSRDIDFSDASELVFDVKGDLPLGGYGDLETTLTESTDRVQAVAFGDGFIAYGDEDNNVYVHDTSDFSLEATLTEATSTVQSLAFGDGFIAYGDSDDRNVYVHDTSDFSLETTLTEAEGRVASLDFGDGFIAYGDGGFGNDDVYVHDTSDFSLETTLSESTDEINGLAFGDGFLAYGGDDENIYVHDTSDFSLETTLTEGTNDINAVAFGNGFLAYGVDDNNVYVHDTSDFSLETTLTESTERVFGVAFDDNGFIAYGEIDGIVYVHDTSDFSLETTLTEATNTVQSVAFGDDLLGYGSSDENVYVHGRVEASAPSSVKVDDQNIFEESIGSDTFVERSADISDFSSVKQLELLISRDIDPSVFESSFGVGATGDGNSFIISDPDSNLEIEFSDIRLE